MEDNIQYPRFYKCLTLAKFKELDTKCCVLLGLPNNEDTIDYANPIVDIQGFNWLVVNTDVSSIFTEAEILAMVQYEDLILPTVNP